MDLRVFQGRQLPVGEKHDCNQARPGPHDAELRATQGQAAVQVIGAAHLRLRSLVSWCYCFLGYTYIAVDHRWNHPQPTGKLLEKSDVVQE